MKALVYTGPHALELREVAEPDAPAAALIAVGHVGICGSDMHAWAGHDARRPAPLILGHEAAGAVIAGPGQGTRVTVNPLVACGRCRACLQGRENLCPNRQIISMPPREGAFCERLAMPPGNLVTIPDGVTTAVASLAEPLACGWHAVRMAESALHIGLDEAECLVLGGGAIGLGAALVLAARGARRIRIVEPQASRRAVLSAAGPFDAIDPGSPDAHSPADLIVDAVGIAATRAAASATASPGGVIAHIGLGSGEGGLDARRMTLQEITFIGTYTYTAADFRATAAAIFDGRLGALDWPEIRPLSEGARAFDDLAAGRVAAPKIILEP